MYQMRTLGRPVRDWLWRARFDRSTRAWQAFWSYCRRLIRSPCFQILVASRLSTPKGTAVSWSTVASWQSRGGCQPRRLAASHRIEAPAEETKRLSVFVRRGIFKLSEPSRSQLHPRAVATHPHIDAEIRAETEQVPTKNSVVLGLGRLDRPRPESVPPRSPRDESCGLGGRAVCHFVGDRCCSENAHADRPTGHAQDLHVNRSPEQSSNVRLSQALE